MPRSEFPRGIWETFRKIAELAVSAALWTGVLIPLGYLFLFNFYVHVINETNHTGGFAHEDMEFFAKLSRLSAGLVLVAAFLNRKWLTPAFLITVLSAAVVFNIHVYERANIMMNYDIWIKKGMPGRCYSLMNYLHWKRSFCGQE